MEYGTVDGIAKPVSRVVLGTCLAPFWRGKGCEELLDKAMERGINAFDTARCYQGAESAVGSWQAKRGLREKIFLICKGANDGLFGRKRITAKCMRVDLEISLNNLQTDYADLYFLHRDDERRPVGEIVEELNELKAEGKIVAFGGSNWTARRLQQANEYAYKHSLTPMVASEPQYGLAVAAREPWKGCITLTGTAKKAEREWYRRENFPVFAYSPLGRGFFSGRGDSASPRTLQRAMVDGAARRAFYHRDNIERLRRAEELGKQLGVSVAQIAAAWTLQSGLNAFVIVGCGKVSTVEKTAAAAEIRLTEEQIAYLAYRE